MKLRKMTVATVAVAAALTMSACSSDDGDSTESTSAEATTSAAEESTAAEGEIAELPTAAELNGLLAQGLDPNVPLEEKTSMVEGSEEDPELINQVAQAARDANVQVEVIDPVIDNGDGTASGQLQLSVNGEPQQGGPAATFVPGENGEWKLSKVTACQIVSLAGLTSAACPA
ncbi:hypothetical protein [Rhodococcus sp. HNM0569]|uniref:hypothetical protein n=1 Tax=Rhodococcus sp. HNM0569 TaxID=2716340 RepID=UPI00146AD7B7|nr:hypothetical protein [Rhodococcus sp. HNM0569]NLU82933.1 hypothetical protein [Rhodococcus sp. HNM0569]